MTKNSKKKKRKPFNVHVFFFCIQSVFVFVFSVFFPACFWKLKTKWKPQNGKDSSSMVFGFFVVKQTICLSAFFCPLKIVRLTTTIYNNQKKKQTIVTMFLTAICFFFFSLKMFELFPSLFFLFVFFFYLFVHYTKQLEKENKTKTERYEGFFLCVVKFTIFILFFLFFFLPESWITVNESF